MKYSSLVLALLFLIGLRPSVRAQWVQTPGLDSTNIQCLAVAGTNLFAGTGGDGVFLSTDAGVSWTSVTNDLPDSAIYAFARNGGNLFAGTDKGVFLSTDNGTNWTSVNNGLTSPKIRALFMHGIDLFAGTDGGGVFASTILATSWTAVNNGLNSLNIYAIAASGNNLFAGGDGGVCVSTDNGAKWRVVNDGLMDPQVRALAEIGFELFAGVVGHGVFVSDNNGVHWTAANNDLGPQTPMSFAASGPNVFFSSERGVFLSTDNGTIWNQVNLGLTDTNAYALAIMGTDLFCGTYRSGVWKRSISEMITSVGDEEAPSSLRFSLMQNYPNPFNPSTTIRYGLPSRSHVTLTVYNTLGQQVATLVEGERAAGFHEVQFEASSLASGVYIYRLAAGDFVQSKKLILVR